MTNGIYRYIVYTRDAHETVNQLQETTHKELNNRASRMEKKWEEQKS